jgi:hypothetical protein
MSRVRLFSLSLGVCKGNAGFPVLGTLKHAQIAAVEWNREAIAQVKAGVVVYGMSSCPHLPIYTWLTIDGFCWAHVGAVPQHGKATVTHFEKSAQEIEELQD